MQVGEVASFQNGYAFKSKDFIQDGKYKIIKIKELKDGKVKFFDNSACVDVENKEIIKKYGVKKGDVLFALTGDPVSKNNPLSWVGRVAVYEDNRLALLNQRVCKLIPKKGLNAKYIYYYFRAFNNFYTLASIAKGSASQANISTKDIEVMEINLPSLDIQNKIVSILDSIEEKINNNNLINKNLEKQVQAIFKYWFIDFVPFNKQKPSEWFVLTLGDVAAMGAGGDKPQNVSKFKAGLYQYPMYSDGLSDEGLYGFTDKPKIFEESVTVSARGTIGFVCLRHIPYVPIVRLVTLIPKKEILSAKYLYLWLKQLHINGTGTTQQQLTVPDFQKKKIVVPTKEIMLLFTDTVEPIFQEIWNNQSENEKLIALRDKLLPKLMSSDLDISSIDI